MSSSTALATGKGVSEHQKAQLLLLARRSRIQWIRSASDDFRRQKNTQDSNGEHNRKSEIAPSALQQTNSKIPGAEVFQRPFNFLSDVVADGEAVSVDSLLHQIDLEDQEHELFDTIANHALSAAPSGLLSSGLLGELKLTSIDDYTYDLFLEQLCSRNAAEIVKSMQQFVSKFESRLIIHKCSLESSYYFEKRANQEEAMKGAESIWNFLDYTVCEIYGSTSSSSHSDGEGSDTMASSSRYNADMTTAVNGGVVFTREGVQSQSLQSQSVLRCSANAMRDAFFYSEYETLSPKTGW